MKHEAIAAPGPEQAGLRGGFCKESLRDYGLLFSLLVGILLTHFAELRYRRKR